MGMMVNRRRVMGGKSLPYDAEVEYLKSTGIQYINIGPVNTPTYNTKVEYKAMLETNISQTRPIVSHGGVGAKTNFTIWEFGDYGGYYFSASGTEKDYASSTVFSQHIVVMRRTGSTTIKYSVNGGYEYTFNGNGFATSSNSDVCLFWHPAISAERKYIGRLYYVKRWQDDILQFDLIPVRVGTTGYMYDKVSGQLFGNAGTGDFILGPDKNSVTIITQQQQHEMYG